MLCMNRKFIKHMSEINPKLSGENFKETFLQVVI